MHSISLFFGSPSPWSFINFLNSTGISKEANIFENSKPTSKNERKHVTFAFLGLYYLIQNDYFQLHPSTCKFHNFVFLKLAEQYFIADICQIFITYSSVSGILGCLLPGCCE